MLENDISKKGICEFKNKFYSKTKIYTYISLRKQVMLLYGLLLKNPGEIRVISGQSKNPGEIRDNFKSASDS